jgi:hypothetical protein
MRVVEHDVQEFSATLVVLYIEGRLKFGKLHSLPAPEGWP